VIEAETSSQLAICCAMKGWSADFEFVSCEVCFWSFLTFSWKYFELRKGKHSMTRVSRYDSKAADKGKA
jgi:hypothetical protein